MNLKLDILQTIHFSMNKIKKVKFIKLIKYEQVLFYNNTRGEKEIVISEI